MVDVAAVIVEVTRHTDEAPAMPVDDRDLDAVLLPQCVLQRVSLTVFGRIVA